MDNISVVIRCKNEEQWIGHSIQSVLDSFDEPEIIIVDNNSTDDSMSIVKMFKKDKLLKGSGNYTNVDGKNVVEKLIVEDNTQIFIKTNTLDMFALKAKFDKKNNIIELFNNVKIFRGKELITGDYAKINTLDESYKITSDKTKKVKVLLNQSND